MDPEGRVTHEEDCPTCQGEGWYVIGVDIGIGIEEIVDPCDYCHGEGTTEVPEEQHAEA
jgi:DnaJ-class molecular chaperone